MRRNKINRTTCRLFGHRWKFNLALDPSKAICTRCKTKIKLDFCTDEWFEVESFSPDDRSDDVLCGKWIS